MRALAVAALVLAAAVPSAASAKGLELGLANDPDGGGHRIRAIAPFGYRYQYLTGDVRGRSGWRYWDTHKSFVRRYVKESRRVHITPVFSYYTLQQSQPGLGSSESRAVRQNLADPGFVKAWLRDMKLALKSTGNTPAIFHFEPDFFGAIQYRHGDRATRQVRRIVHQIFALRNRVAPRVKLAYAVSVWGTHVDPVLDNPSLRKIDRMARRSVRFYRSLGVRWDVVFGEMDDRDSGYNEFENDDGGRSWWTKGDWDRHVRFYRRFHAGVRRPIVMWQVPLGNSTLDDSWKHYRDNKVETLLGDPKRTMLKRYTRAGVTAFLFGPGTEGCTTDRSDGGVFYRLARQYYRRGRLRLP
jgi:hypothetical protein